MYFKFGLLWYLSNRFWCELSSLGDVSWCPVWIMVNSHNSKEASSSRAFKVKTKLFKSLNLGQSQEKSNWKKLLILNKSWKSRLFTKMLQNNHPSECPHVFQDGCQVAYLKDLWHIWKVDHLSFQKTPPNTFNFSRSLCHSLKGTQKAYASDKNTTSTCNKQCDKHWRYLLCLSCTVC